MAKSETPVQNALGDRQLAAILFTDVAGFSKLIEANETHTLLLVQRDLKFISDVCHQYGGDVLKNTGDGCLAAFRSVDSAVRSALKIQEAVAEAASRMPPEKILHHRIGIHLGDVFMSKGDVLGNGVNIAARLLAEAEPDGICISQAVYDVVKHQLGLKAVFIGARELKNIREAVPVYRLLLGAAAKEQGEHPPSEPAAPVNRPKWLIALAVVVAGAMIGAGGWLLFRPKQPGNVASDLRANNPIPTSAPARQIETVAPQIAAAAISSPATSPAPWMDGLMKRPPTFSADSTPVWNTFPHLSNANVTATVENDRYVLSVKGEGYRMGQTQCPWGSLDDMVIEATGRVIVNGPQNTNTWWALTLIAAEGPRKLVRLFINDKGAIRVDLSRLTGIDDQQRALRPNEVYQYTYPSIRRGTDPNTLLIGIRDHMMTVLVNDELVGRPVDITPLGRASIMQTIEGFQVGRIEFERLRVWVPSQSGK